MNRIQFILCFVLGYYLASGQGENMDYNKISSDNIEWSEGSIILSDGKKIQGLLKYNSKTGLLSFESGAVSKSFTARTAMSFDYFDALTEIKRTYISVEYGDLKDKTNLERVLGTKNDNTTQYKKVPQFFEILIELPSFALLSSTGNLEVKTSTQSFYNGNGTSTTPFISGPITTTYSQTEVLFIFDAEGNINPLLEITNKEHDSSFIDTKNTKRKKLDGEALEQYTSPHYKKLEEYAKENKLKFKKKEDLIKILEYYRTLII